MIEVNRGEINLSGEVSVLVAETAVVILSLLDEGVPKALIDMALADAFEEHKRRNKKENNENFRKLLKKLGIEED